MIIECKKCNRTLGSVEVKHTGAQFKVTCVCEAKYLISKDTYKEQTLLRHPKFVITDDPIQSLRDVRVIRREAASFAERILVLIEDCDKHMKDLFPAVRKMQLNEYVAEKRTETINDVVASGNIDVLRAIAQSLTQDEMIEVLKAAGLHKND